MPYKNIFLLITIAGLILLPGCSSIQIAHEIDDGNYKVLSDFTLKNNSVKLKRNQVLYIEDYTDSVIAYIPGDLDTMPVSIVLLKHAPLKLKKVSQDIDLFVVPFKIRPSQKGFPSQLNANFNTSLYLGFRKDYYKIFSATNFKNSTRRKIYRNGFGTGCFVGLSNVQMNPWVTQNQINYEYDGFAMSYGISAIYGVQKFTAGIALGYDYLTDKNKNLWIYQNRPWVGVLIGLNLN